MKNTVSIQSRTTQIETKGFFFKKLFLLVLHHTNTNLDTFYVKHCSVLLQYKINDLNLWEIVNKNCFTTPCFFGFLCDQKPVTTNCWKIDQNRSCLIHNDIMNI